MAVKITRPPTVRFVQIRNEWARDRRISYKAVGLLTYLHSHEDGYELSLSQIVRDHTDGKDAVRTGLTELEAAGYLRQVRGRADGGRFGEVDYVLSDPFDAAGRLIPDDRRILRPADAGTGRETRQGGFSGAGYPARETRPIEENRENTTGEGPTDPPAADRQLALVSPPEPPGLSAAAAFDTFWAAYPKKVGKDAARRAWGKAARRADPAHIIDVVRRYPFREDRQFVKDPATWLNAGCWDDDLEAVAAANRPRPVGSRGYGAAAPYRNPDPSTPDAFNGSF